MTDGVSGITMGTVMTMVACVMVGFVAFPLLLFVLRDVLPPTLFMPSDWDD